MAMALSKRMNSVNEPYDTSDRNSFLKIVVVRAAEEEEVWNKKSHQEDAMGGRSATNNFNSHQQLLPKTAPSSAPHTGCPKKTHFQNHHPSPTIHPSPQAWLAGFKQPRVSLAAP